MTGPATIYGVGLGPGDPELMSVKAARLIGKAGVVAHFRKHGRPGNARTMVEGLLAPDAVEEALEYPVTTEIAFDDPAYSETLRAFYDGCVRRLLAHVAEGRDVAVLCEGDPFLYGSFMHLHSRIVGRAPVVVVPGIIRHVGLLDRERRADHLRRRRADRGAGDARRGALARAVPLHRRAGGDEARPQSARKCAARCKPPVSPNGRFMSSGARWPARR